MNKMLAIIDATFNENLESLTIHRMLGALPFSGKFRLIDFTLSNLANSDITNVAIFPFGNYRSLQDHVGSGKRWDLDRRRDGLFILPPKNLYILPGRMITFQRMNEHREFLRRSTQDYVVFTSANIVWNIDFNDVLEDHLKSKKDITEVLYENIRLRTYIISKKLLGEYIESYDSLEYKTISDLVDRASNISVNIYRHDTYTRTITDTYNYLKCNLDMLKFDIGKTIFRADRPIYSKEKTSPPAKYLSNAKVTNSMISAGAIIDGYVENSVIARDVVIKKGAIVKNSFVMSNTFVEENASINYAILDKQTVLKQDVVIEGTLTNPFVSHKEQIIYSSDKNKILMVASESYPFIKTGGLADVIGSLSRNLVRTDVDVTVILPFYKKIKDTFKESIRRLHGRTIIYDNKKYKIVLFTYTYKKVKYYFIESFDFFDYDHIYGLENDIDRFAFFNKAVVEILDELPSFDLIHIHDWHTGLIPLILDNSPYKGLKTLLTIHNIDYQGIGSNDVIRKLGIKNFIFREPTINALNIGIDTATKISTVSPTYKEELKYEYYGKNLTYTLSKRERDFYGILNGISSSFNPSKDKLIHQHYSYQTIDKKLDNKLFLQKEMGLEVNTDMFVIGMVTRIVEQKGFDLIVQRFDEIMSHDKIQFVLLGTGDPKYHYELMQLEKQYPGRVKMNIGYDATIPNYIYAGADVFLMPSRFEPCGLGQMISLKYGTLPIVRGTGGLKDSVLNYESLTKKGTGFVFYNYDSKEMYEQITIAYNLFSKEKETWLKLVKRAMNENNSILKAAQKYNELYKAIIQN